MVGLMVPSAFAATNSVSNDIGSLQTLGNKFYQGDESLIKIFGEINEYLQGAKLTIIVTYPDGEIVGQQIFVTKDGEFNTFHSLTENSQIGSHKITADYGGKIIGSVYFDVGSAAEKAAIDKAEAERVAAEKEAAEKAVEQAAREKAEKEATKSKQALDFVDQSKDPSYYVNRYNSEPAYKDWFDTSFPNYTIWEGIGISQQEYRNILSDLTRAEPEPQLYEPTLEADPEPGTHEDPGYDTYSNSDLNFSIKYPKDWQVITNEFDVKFNSPTKSENIEVFLYLHEEIDYSHLPDDQKLEEIISYERMYVEGELGGTIENIRKNEIINSESATIFNIEYEFQTFDKAGLSITRLYEIHTEHAISGIYLNSNANSECEKSNYCEDIFHTATTSFTILDENVEIVKPYLTAIREIENITTITNPKNVHNSAFYNINTECELKHLYYKDPNQANRIYNVINNSSDRIEQEYFARGGQMVEYGDRGALDKSHALQGEIIAEVIMEKYSINPVLKDIVIRENDEGREYSLEAEMIQYGTHPCEEEFKLFSPDKAHEQSPTKIRFTDEPVFGMEVGQWVKMSVEFNVDTTNRDLKTLFDDMAYFLRPQGTNFSLDEIEWSKIEVVELTEIDVTTNRELMIIGKSELFKAGTEVYSFDELGSFQYGNVIIPTNVKVGHIMSEEPYGQLVVTGFEKKTYGGKSIETIHITGSGQSYNLSSDVEMFYDKKTGMLLEIQMVMFASDGIDNVTMELGMKAVDFHIPSANIISGGGGCLIATAAFGSEMEPQVQFLRELRDNTVLQTQSGTSFMTAFNSFYYSFSPTIADYERENPAFKEAVKLTLTPLLTSLTLLNYVDIDTESEMLGYGIGVILLNIGMYFVAPAAVIIALKNRIKVRK